MQFSKYSRSIYFTEYYDKNERIGSQDKKLKDHKELKTLWNTRKKNGEDVWPKGKLMEYFIAKAF